MEEMDKLVVSWKQCTVKNCSNRTLWASDNKEPPICVPHDIELVKVILTNISYKINFYMQLFMRKSAVKLK